MKYNINSKIKGANMDNKKNKPKRLKYRFSIIFFGTVLIFGIVFYNYMKTTTLEDVLLNQTIQNELVNNEQESTTQTTEVKVEKPKVIVNPVPESNKADAEYLNNCVFIGDSLTYGLSTYGLVPANSVYASISMNVAKAETTQIDTQYGKITALEALQQRNPENVYILLGSNGVAYMTVSDMYQSYSDFVTKVQGVCPDANICLISVPPVTEDREVSKESPISNTDIIEFNQRILDFANAKGYYYLDLHSATANDNSALIEEYAENDGLHFNLKAYEAFVEYILTHTIG